jgi:hypothetical protein
MTYLVSVNEVTIFYLLWRVLCGGKSYVLAINPYFLPMTRCLQFIFNWLKKKDKVLDVRSLCPELDHVHDIYAEIYLYNILGKIENWQNNYFEFNHVDKRIPDYALSYKYLTCNYLRTHYLTILTLNHILTDSKKSNIKIIGLLPSVSEASRAFNNTSEPETALWLPWCLLNVFIFFGLSFYAIGWILLHTRPALLKRKQIRFMADYVGHSKDLTLVDKMAEKSLKDVMLIQRFDDPIIEHERDYTKYPSCTLNDGRFDPYSALKGIGKILCDGARLLRFFCTREPALYFQIAMLPYRRIILRALFNRFQPKYFWGRDDYNVEHILRRQELHNVGGISLGINHGFPSYTNLFPQWRYISFDRYYVFGRAVHDRIYKDTWAKDMAVIPIGSFYAATEDYDLIGIEKPKDIVVFCAVFTGNPQFVKIVRSLAKAFPNRTIWLQIKINYRSFQRATKFIEDCSRGLKNVVYTTEWPRALFSRASYAVSDASTTVIEALQFGLASFMADIHPDHEVCLYREFDGLCIKSARTLIERINNIENGSWKYSRESYGELIDLSGRPFTDIILEDIEKNSSFHSLDNTLKKTA